MGSDLGLNCISTGAVTRMDLTKASSKFVFIYVFLMHIVCSLLLPIECFFPIRMGNVALITVWSGPTLKASNGSILTISVQLELISLTVCELHNHCIINSI